MTPSRNLEGVIFMLSALKKLFNRQPPQDKLAAQRERLMAIKNAETVESARHPHMHKADINALIHTFDPQHAGGHAGSAKRAKDAPVVPSWLRAEPNTFPERTPMLYRIFLITADAKGRPNYEHQVMVSNNVLKKDDVTALFAAWDEEALRIAQLPPEPEEKKPSGETPPPPAP